jgi:hypothetical protein
MSSEVKGGMNALLGSLPATSAIHTGGRAFGLYPRHNRRVPHISLVFREMWDTKGLPLKLAAGLTDPHGCPMLAPAYVDRKRWAKPSTAFSSGPYPLFIRTGA